MKQCQRKDPSFDYRRALVQELAVRRVRNPSYSLRCFARDLGVSLTALSEVLGGKRRFSKQNALRIVQKLGWSPLQQMAFLENLSHSGGKPIPLDDNGESAIGAESLLLYDDHFRFISDWYYLVILNLSKIGEAQGTPEWVSSKTGIGVPEAADAIERLQRMGYIVIEKGRMRRKVPAVKTTTGIPSAAIRKYHRQNFMVAETVQEHVPFSRRHIASVTVATDPDRVRKAKRLSDKFLDRLAKILESDAPTEVYTLAVQLFPARFFTQPDPNNVDTKEQP